MPAPPLLHGRIKYEAELAGDFADEVASIPGGEGLFQCIQCGTCSGVCPVALSMDYTPRRLVNMVRSGFKDEVLHSRTIWLCTSCYACTVNCPAGIPITDVMYALKRMAIREGTYPEELATPFVTREFVGPVERWGRTSEARLALKLNLRAGLHRTIKSASLGLRLLRRGRLGLRRDSIRQRAQLRTVLEAAEATNGTPAPADRYAPAAAPAIVEGAP